jgi:hypothetical protein
MPARSDYTEKEVKEQTDQRERNKRKAWKNGKDGT